MMRANRRGITDCPRPLSLRTSARADDIRDGVLVIQLGAGLAELAPIDQGLSTKPRANKSSQAIARRKEWGAIDLTHRSRWAPPNFSAKYADSRGPVGSVGET
jgi:hypothetical protein